MAAAAKPQTIRKIVRKAAGGHAHSSAWKVAYADFVTAMMAFFLMLWLIGVAGEETLEGIAQYFSDARINVMPAAGGFAAGEAPGSPGARTLQGAAAPLVMTDPGSPTVIEGAAERYAEEEVAAGDAASVGDGLGDGAADEPGLPDLARPDPAAALPAAEREAMRFAEARAAIMAAIEQSPELGWLKEMLAIDQTREGLRIQILDRDRLSMFPLGSSAMNPHARALLGVVATAIAGLPNKLSIRGHTDALPYAPTAAYDNWRLSSDRANATRLALEERGIATARIAEVVGKADAEPLVADRPLDPTNRRISIVLLSETPPTSPGT